MSILEAILPPTSSSLLLPQQQQQQYTTTDSTTKHSSTSTQISTTKQITSKTPFIQNAILQGMHYSHTLIIPFKILIKYQIAMSVALFMSALVSGAAIYNEALEARCVKCHGDNSCQNGVSSLHLLHFQAPSQKHIILLTHSQTPFPPECKKGCCQEY